MQSRSGRICIPTHDIIRRIDLNRRFFETETTESVERIVQLLDVDNRQHVAFFLFFRLDLFVQMIEILGWRREIRMVRVGISGGASVDVTRRSVRNHLGNHVATSETLHWFRLEVIDNWRGGTGEKVPREAWSSGCTQHRSKDWSTWWAQSVQVFLFFFGFFR